MENYGLKSQEVLLMRERFGSNVLSQKKKRGILGNLFANFGDPMIKVLLIALAVNVVFLFGHSNWYESLGIAAAVLIAIVVQTVSEYGSESAFEKLKNQSENSTNRVMRDGKTVILPASELVRGDVVLISEGEKIPADGVILSGSLEVDQSALNGESKEARKYPCDQGEEGFLNPRLLFGGTVAAAGSCVMEISAVGDSTFYGRLAADLQQKTPDSPLKVRLSKLAKKISLYGYVGAGVVALSYLFNAILIKNHFSGGAIMETMADWRTVFSLVINALTLAVTVIVMAVPEGLPMMITVVLSSNMRRMLRDKVLVRKLSGIETAGSMNILFTDKTGTLTAGRLEVMKLVTGEGAQIDAADIQKAEKAYFDILMQGISQNNGAQIIDGRAAGGNATDRALLDFALKHSQIRQSRKTKTIPFSSHSKFMATTLAGGITLIKGAPEKLLDASTHCYNSRGEVVSFAQKRRVLAAAEGLAERAVRVLAIAVSTHEISQEKPFEGLIFVGLVGIRDVVRREAAVGVRRVKSAGIKTVMITGDSKATAAAIAREVGILEDGGLVITSDELAMMGDAELCSRLKYLSVVARALPSDKSRLVKAAQSIGLVVGMTGDGVNDAPALKLADIGFAMGSGTEVAKEAGDIVILDDNIMSISRAVSYGRTIFKSIRKFIIFQLTINFCAMALSIVSPLIGAGSPVSVIQMLWINLVIDTLAGLAFGGERPRTKYMQEPPKRRDEPIINRYMWQQIISASVFISLLCLWFLKSPVVMSRFGSASPKYVSTAFFTLFMFTAIFNSLNTRTHEINLFDYLALNKQFIWIMSSIMIVQGLMVYFGSEIFGMTPLSIRHFGSLLCLSLLIIPFDLVRKGIVRKRGMTEGT